MAEWTFYAARGIVSYDRLGKAFFNPEQIEEGLRIGLMPQIILTPGAQDPTVISSLSKYLEAKDISGVPLKITVHGEGRFVDSDLLQIKQSVDALVEVNEKSSDTMFKEIVFHAGAVHTFEEECRLRAQPEYYGYSNLDTTFTLREYMETLAGIRSVILQVSEYAKESGINLIIENVGQVNYAVVPSQKAEDKSEDFRKDLRWADTIWLPEALQVGDVGCVYDLDFLTGGKLPICIDIEHLGQSVEYSQDCNLEDLEIYDMTDEEATVLDDLCVFIRKGYPVLYEHLIDPAEIIGRFDGRIPICHIGGQVNMVYDDVDELKIGSHMPVTFGDDPNEYIECDGLRLRENAMRQEKLEKYLRVLHDARCRSGVLELHLGPCYVGDKWRFYNELSLRNVKSIIDKL
ncbi:MAG: hypothetical protein KAR23_06010 [Candidatus Aenigmarchaeota archaeon]|nr:hypothetical protein [Candidatus Aenigmarchaeota archaeon]